MNINLFEMTQEEILEIALQQAQEIEQLKQAKEAKSTGKKYLVEHKAFKDILQGVYIAPKSVQQDLFDSNLHILCTGDKKEFITLSLKCNSGVYYNANSNIAKSTKSREGCESTYKYFRDFIIWLNLISRENFSDMIEEIRNRSYHKIDDPAPPKPKPLG